MVTYDPSKRITAKEAMEHRYLKNVRFIAPPALPHEDDSCSGVSSRGTSELDRNG